MYLSYRLVRFIHNLNSLLRRFMPLRKSWDIKNDFICLEEIISLKEAYSSLNPRTELFEATSLQKDQIDGINIRVRMQIARNNRKYIDVISGLSKSYSVKISDIAMESAIYILRASMIGHSMKVDTKILNLHYNNLKRRLQWNYPFSGNHLIHELCALNIGAYLFDEKENYREVLSELLQKEILIQINSFGHYERSANYSLQVYETLLYFCHTYGKNSISIGTKSVIWESFRNNVEWQVKNRFSYGNTDDSSILYPGIVGHNEKEYISLLMRLCPEWMEDLSFHYPDYTIDLKNCKVIIRFNELSRIESKRHFTHNFTGISLHLYRHDTEMTLKPNFIYGLLSPEKKRSASFYNQLACDKSLDFYTDFEISQNMMLSIDEIKRTSNTCKIIFWLGNEKYDLVLKWSQNELKISASEDVISCNWLLSTEARFNFSSDSELNIKHIKKEGLLKDKTLLKAPAFTNNLNITW